VGEKIWAQQQSALFKGAQRRGAVRGGLLVPGSGGGRVGGGSHSATCGGGFGGRHWPETGGGVRHTAGASCGWRGQGRRVEGGGRGLAGVGWPEGTVKLFV
jgi:hypothetical protein